MVPALAVAGELRADGAEVVFAGGERAEVTLVPEAGYELHQLRVQGLSRTNPLKAAKAALMAVGATFSAWRLLGRLKPDAVMGGGGYVAGVVGIAAVLRRIPLVLTEADSHLGVSNRLLARFARAVCLAFPLEGHDGAPFVVTGRPVPDPCTERAAARETFGIGEDDRCVLVFGGSLGARSVNLAAVEGLAGGDFHVLHASGTRDHEMLVERLGDPPPDGYDLRAYIAPFAPALAAADLCVARSGGSVFEVAAHGVPAILVPYPHAAADHQTANARWMVDAGAAVLIRDDELTGQGLRAEVDALLGDPVRLRAMADASAGLARPRAAKDIAAQVTAAAAR